MTGFTAQPDDLNASAPQYDAVSQEVQAIYQALTANLDSEGACWGADDAGTAFGTKYVAQALLAIKQLDSTNQGLQGMVDGICTWAKNYVTAEELAKLSATQLNNTNNSVDG